MPSWPAHRYVDIVYFKKSYYKIHRAMDRPVKYLGRGHRVLFHDPINATLIAKHYYPHDANAIRAAHLHIQIDRLCSANPTFKKYLETLAKAASKKRKKQKTKHPFDTIPGVDPRLIEIAELWTLLRKI